MQDRAVSQAKGKLLNPSCVGTVAALPGFDVDYVAGAFLQLCGTYGLSLSHTCRLSATRATVSPSIR